MGKMGIVDRLFHCIASFSALLKFQAKSAKLSNISNFIVDEHEAEHLKPESLH